jgi:copper chaperone CopZ
MPSTGRLSCRPGVPGVAEAAVNLATARARVRFSGAADPAAAVRAIDAQVMPSTAISVRASGTA